MSAGYDAILIEDDKDDRFLKVLEDGTAEIDYAGWNAYKDKVTAEINKLCPGIPVIFFLAAPEVEAWLIADWKSSFAKIYRGHFTQKEHKTFQWKLYDFVVKKILTARYKNSIESYGYFENKYAKLSENIQEALESPEFWETLSSIAVRNLHYSKKLHGRKMLAEIEPERVLGKCSVFFRDAYFALREL